MPKIDLNVQTRNKRELGTFSVDSSSSVAAFKEVFARKNPQYYPSRQWFTIGEGETQIRLTDPDKTLQDYGLKDKDTLIFKDLGPQIGWRTVFLIEYFGPILIHLVIYLFPQLVYGENIPNRHPVAQIGLACVLFHYLKRELETIFVHRFSAETMPFFNVFKNSSHYWILSGLFIAYPLYHPQYSNPFPLTFVYAGVVVFLIAEFGNLWAHLVLRDLRPSGTRTRGIPRGGLFELVSCANYTYELIAWAAFSFFTSCITAWLFFAVSFAQIYVWAVKKHKRYRTEFSDYPRRKALIPFLA